MMSAVQFPIVISYSQITVFDPSFEKPFNDWTDQHVAQGFSWRPGSVSFGTIEESGIHLITVNTGSGDFSTPLSAIRIIDVPFDVPSSGSVEIASISDSKFIELAPGAYQLRFECTAGGDAGPSIRFLFWQSMRPVFRLVRIDPDLHPGPDLLLTASPA